MTTVGTIRIDQVLSYPPARVWKALTDSALLARWLMPNDFELKLGHRFTFTTAPIQAVKFSGIIHCQVLDFEAERRLRISWDSAEHDGLHSTVTWRLEPAGDGTHLFMEHSGFDLDHPLQELSHRMMSGGWRSMPDRLAAALAAEDR